MGIIAYTPQYNHVIGKFILLLHGIGGVNLYTILGFIVGGSIVLYVFTSLNIIGQRLKTIENQNNSVIQILEEIRDKI